MIMLICMIKLYMDMDMDVNVDGCINFLLDEDKNKRKQQSQQVTSTVSLYPGSTQR